jgi:hypothetical protein
MSGQVHKKCLINLSNHPFESWGEAQKQAAIREFGEVEDLPFPEIPPQWGIEEVNRLAEEMTQQIVERQPLALHLAGEFTFCYQLAKRLEAAGIRCVVATSRRMVQQLADNRKEVRFEFVRFRDYYSLK